MSSGEFRWGQVCSGEFSSVQVRSGGFRCSQVSSGAVRCVKVCVSAVRFITAVLCLCRGRTELLCLPQVRQQNMTRVYIHSFLLLTDFVFSSSQSVNFLSQLRGRGLLSDSQSETRELPVSYQSEGREEER